MTGHVLAMANEVISYDYSTNHQAVDLVSENRAIDDVIAFDDGIVEVVVKDFKYTDHNSSGTDTYGNFVKIRHSDGTKSLYAHMKYGSICVYQGEKISKGQKIGTIGNTGNAYGVHLHFEMRDSSDNRLNPKEYLYRKVDENTHKDNENIENSDVSYQDEVKVNDQITSSDDNSSVLDDESTVSDDESTVSDDEPAILDDDSLVIDERNEDYEDKDYVNNHKVRYLSNYSYKDGSIVDGLKDIGMDSSFDYRLILAKKNGIKKYRGSYAQNVYLLTLLKLGKLKA